MKYLSLTLLVALTIALIAAQPTPGQEAPPSGFDKDRGRDILNVIKSDLKKHYYDQAFHGMDVDVRFKTAEEKIKTAASHTFFLPPGRAARTDYGWRMQMIGDKCFVTAVRPGSDAEAKGLKAGDEILSIDRKSPTRENFWKLEYYYYSVRPQPGITVEIRKPNGQEAE